jgi:hypothetical protein
LTPVTGLGQRDVTHMELEVEVGILDPVGMIEVERDSHQPLAEHPGLVQPTLELGEDPFERDLAAGRG